MSNEYKDWLNDIELEIKQTDKLFMETICPISYESKKEAFKLYLFMFGSDNLAGKKLAEWFEEAKYEYGYGFNDLYGLVLKKGLEQTQNELKDEVKSIMDLEVNFNYEESEFVAKDNNNTIELINKIKNELKYAIADKGIEWFKENISDTVYEVLSELKPSISLKNLIKNSEKEFTDIRRFK